MYRYWVSVAHDCLYWAKNGFIFIKWKRDFFRIQVVLQFKFAWEKNLFYLVQLPQFIRGMGRGVGRELVREHLWPGPDGQGRQLLEGPGQGPHQVRQAVYGAVAQELHCTLACEGTSWFHSFFKKLQCVYQNFQKKNLFRGEIFGGNNFDLFICSAAGPQIRKGKVLFFLFFFSFTHVQFIGVWKGKNFASKGVWIKRQKLFLIRGVKRGKNVCHGALICQHNTIFQTADQWKDPFLVTCGKAVRS